MLLHVHPVYLTVNAHIVSVSKDSGFYTEDPDEEDPVIERGTSRGLVKVSSLLCGNRTSAVCYTPY